MDNIGRGMNLIRYRKRNVMEGAIKETLPKTRIILRY